MYHQQLFSSADKNNELLHEKLFAHLGAILHLFLQFRHDFYNFYSQNQFALNEDNIVLQVQRLALEIPKYKMLIDYEYIFIDPKLPEYFLLDSVDKVAYLFGFNINRWCYLNRDITPNVSKKNPGSRQNELLNNRNINQNLASFELQHDVSLKGSLCGGCFISETDSKTKRSDYSFSVWSAWDFSGANMFACNLSFTQFENCYFDECNLTDVLLTGSIISDSSFCGAFCRGISFVNHSMTARLERCNFEGSDFSLSPHHKISSFCGVQIIDSSFARTNLYGALMKGCYIQNCDFTYANLQTCNLDYLVAIGCDFTGTNLNHACLRNADLTNSNFTSANLTAANLASTDLRGVNLKDANFDRAILTDVKNVTADQLIAAKNIDKVLWEINGSLITIVEMQFQQNLTDEAIQFLEIFHSVNRAHNFNLACFWGPKNALNLQIQGESCHEPHQIAERSDNKFYC